MNTLLFLGLAGLGTPEVIIILIVLSLVVYALLDIFKSNMPQNTKLYWIIIILIVPVLGSLIYLLWGRKQHI